jgi:hypothetical protein
MNIRLRLPFVALVVFILFSHCVDNAIKRDYPLLKDPEVINITSAGVTFTAEVTEAGNYPITEHGFVWGESKSLNESYSERISLGSFSGTGSFQSDITTTLVVSKSYYVSAYLKAGDYTVYSEPVEFVSLGSQAPVVTGFSPKAVEWGDTVIIYGKNFSNRSGSNTVSFGAVDVTLLYSYCDTIIKCRFPIGVTAKKSAVSVSIVGNKGTLKGDSITFLAPELISYYPTQARYSDTVCFRGRHLTEISSSSPNGAYFGTVKSTFLNSTTDTLIKARVPELLATINNTMSLKINGITLISGTSFTLLPPVIDSISPKTASWGSSVKMFGKFNSSSSMNSVTIGGLKATLESVNTKYLQFTVPSALTTVSNSVVLVSGPFTVTSPDLFSLTPPQIKYFTPASGPSGTQVKIGGKYFKSGLTHIYFGTSEAAIKSLNDSVIYCYAPAVANGNYNLNVTVSTSTVTSKSSFTISNPNIKGLSPTSVSYGDLVTVTGSGFVAGMTWTLGSNTITPTLISSTQATITVPYSLTYTPLNVSVSNTVNSVTNTTSSSDYLWLKDFTVTSITPLTGKGGSVLTLTGTNLNPNLLTVTIGSTQATLSGISSTGATITVPGLSNGEHYINISFGGKAVTYPNKFVVSGSPWTKLTDLPFLKKSMCVFDFGENILVSNTGSTSTERVIYSFNPETKTFNLNAGTYTSVITAPYSCVLNGKGYVLGITDYSTVALEVFNPDSLTWRRLKDFPGTYATQTLFLADDSVLYAGGGNVKGYGTYLYSDFWKFSPKTKKWTRLKNLPSCTCATNHIFINNKILVAPFWSYYIYEYLPSSNTWTVYGPNNVGEVDKNRISLSLNGNWYVGFGATNTVYKYDPITTTSSALSYVAPESRTTTLDFTVGGYIFLGGGQSSNYYDFWMYDPSKE